MRSVLWMTAIVILAALLTLRWISWDGASGVGPIPSKVIPATAPAEQLPQDAQEPEPVPLASEGWLNSGWSLAVPYTGPISDPNSLEQLREAIAGRGYRGVRKLRETLASWPDPAAHPETIPTRIEHLKEIAALLMYEGDFRQAVAVLEDVLELAPEIRPEERANFEAMIGVAELRRGETENCIECVGAASCLFPLAPEAVHLVPSGSEQAMSWFLRYLQHRPEDLGVRWLLNLAAMTLGQYPEAVPEPYRLPVEAFDTEEVELPPFPNVALEVGLHARGPNMAGASVVDDFDNDGHLDLFVASLDRDRGASLFRNRGDGTFEHRSEQAGLSDQVFVSNAQQADYDNDGHLDLILLRGGWETPHRLSLLRNRGDGTFEDVTIEAGLNQPIATQAGVWGDYDNDGHLDLFVCAEYESLTRPFGQSRLYRNNGDGTFTDVTASAGVFNTGVAKGAAWGDFDNDGWIDLYVSNLAGPNRLFRNRGDGTFEDVTAHLGVAEPIHSFACWFWDVDNDGWLDLFVTGYKAFLPDVISSALGQPAGGARPRLYRNLGPEGFRDVTEEFGLDVVLMPMGCNFGDIDNDGFLDMYLATGAPGYEVLTPNVLFKNLDGKRFVDVTAATRTGHLQKGHGTSFGDFDGDGTLDLVVAMGGATPGDRAYNALFRNPGFGNHWITVELVGTTSNRSAIGARLSLTLSDQQGHPLGERHRLIGSGSSFGGNSLRATIGLGQATRIESLTVAWPNRSHTRQTFRDVPINRAIRIVEGRDAIELVASPQSPRPSSAVAPPGFEAAAHLVDQD